LSLSLEFRVLWPGGRAVRVHCYGLSLLNNRTLTDPAPTLILNSIDVVSADALHEFLRRATRLVAAGELVEVGALEPTVLQALEVLGIGGPPPRPIEITLAAP